MLGQPNSNVRASDPGLCDLRFVKYSHVQSSAITSAPIKLEEPGHVDVKEIEMKKKRALKNVET